MKENIARLVLLAALLASAGCDAGPQETPAVTPPTASTAAVTVTPPPASATPSPIPPAPTPSPTAPATLPPPSATPLPPTAAPATRTPAATATRTAQPSPTVIMPATPGVAAADGAVQTLLDYWAAVNQRDYQRAYRYWNGDGSASGQSYDQFARGFAETVQVAVRIGDVGAQDSTALTATLPVTLTAVANVPASPTQDQRAQQFRGSYTMQRSGQAWRISSAKITEVTSPVLPAADMSDPLRVLQAYFEAINRRQFARAYTLWNQSGAASQQSYAQFHQVLAAAGNIEVRLGKPQVGAAAGSSYAEVTVLMVLTPTGQPAQAMCGGYTLRRANIPPFERFGWGIENASMVPIADVRLDAAIADKLLSQGCG